MTTICSVKFNGKTAIAGDGQVTLGEKVIAKTSAKKIRRIYHDRVVIGFAGGVADAVSLQEMLEGKLEAYSGDLRRAAVEMAQAWRKDPTLQKLNAMLIAFDEKTYFLFQVMEKYLNQMKMLLQLVQVVILLKLQQLQ